MWRHVGTRKGREHARVHRRDEQGFTFIELMISLAIFTIGFTALVVMQMTMIDSVRRANDTALATNLTSAMLEEIELMDSTVIAVGTMTARYFSHDGTELPDSTGNYFAITPVATASGANRIITATCAWQTRASNGQTNVEDHSLVLQSTVGQR